MQFARAEAGAASMLFAADMVVADYFWRGVAGDVPELGRRGTSITVWMQTSLLPRYVCSVWPKMRK